jgi:hypothetical protein
MSTLTILPSSLLAKDGAVDGSTNTGGSWANATDPNIVTYLSDAADTTGVRSAAAQTRSLQVALAAPTIPGGEFVARVGGWIRWSNGKSGKVVGCLPYRQADGAPGYAPTLPVTGSTSPTTTEVASVPVAWSTVDAAALALQVTMEGAATAADRPVLWAAGATVYTLALASATPSATTATSTYPTIPVTVAATIGWEAPTYNWQLLRKVTVEIRVESGGTGPGTGTLMSTATGDVWFTATGSQVVNLSVPDALANGTYKVYARASRHREGETAVLADQVGVWSAAATLTVSGTAPTTPTFTLAADPNADTMTATITPVAGGGYTQPSVVLERSDDGQATWTPVRNATNIAAAFGVATVLVDYEAPRGRTVYYRARVLAYLSGVLNGSAWATSVPVSVPADAWNLKCPQAPNINVVNVTVVGNPDESLGEDLGVFRPTDRRYPVIVSGQLTGWDGSLKIHTAGATEWSAVKALIESQRILLLESAFGTSKYIRLMPGPRVVLKGTSTLPRREVDVSYVETASPVGVAPVLPSEITVVIDGGAASTVSWADTLDGGAAGTVTWVGFVDGGSV